MASATSLNRRIVNGTFWTIVGYGTSQMIRFASNLVLTRLLAPELFGLMALVNVFLVGLQLFSDVGITPSIVQNKRGEDPDFYNTAWTIQVLRGMALWIVCCLITYPVAQFYQEPQLYWLLPVVSLSTIISGFNCTAFATLKRRLEVGRIAIYEILVQVVSISILLIWAYLNPTIYALAGGSVVGAVIKTAFSYWLIRGYKNWFAWDKTALQEIFSFGRWIFVATAMTFLATQTDRLMLGKLISIEVLGVYTIAATLADLPRQVIGLLGSNVIFPTISRSLDTPRSELRTKILGKRWILLLGAAIALTIMVSLGDLVIRTLYDSRYNQAAWMLPVLALSLWHTLLYNSMNPCLMGVGRPVYGAIGNMLRFLILLVVMPFSYDWLGIGGVIITIAFSDLPMYFVVVYGLWKEKLNTAIQDIKATVLFLILLAASLGLREWLGFGSPFTGLF
ncbi:oligosaccharide flippase family protein [Leptolyngbya sp. AN02str]|uniref:oligosaccharide flippase family protein n=1 Tax=Leptolyngbya sp. AN02str TaxID=3423363 RepID=UPI003D316BAD